MEKTEAATVTCAHSVWGSDMNQCYGPADSQKLPCCSTTALCVLKNDNYGQCRPADMEIPEGWLGAIVNYGAPTTTASSTETTETTEPIKTTRSTDAEEPAATTEPAEQENTTSVATVPEVASPTTGGAAMSSADKFTAHAGKDFIPGAAQGFPMNVEVRRSLPSLPAPFSCF